MIPAMREPPFARADEDADVGPSIGIVIPAYPSQRQRVRCRRSKPPGTSLMASSLGQGH